MEENTIKQTEQEKPNLEEPAKEVEKVKEPDRRDELEKSMKGLSDERGKHEKAVKECSGQRRKLKKSFNDMKQSRKKKVDEILEDNFLDQSEKGLIDKVLTTAIKEPKLHQLQDSILKLESQEEWHRKKLAEISKQESKHKGLLDRLASDRAIRECYRAYKSFSEVYFKAEDAFDRFRHSVVRARQLDPAFSRRLKDVKIEDDMFHHIVDSKLKPGIVENITMAIFVDKISGIYLIKNNIFYDDPSSPKRRLQKTAGSIPHRRDEF
jgi:hypothetical protein